MRIVHPRRNDKCPCGSGKKFKHCHGTARFNSRSGYLVEGTSGPISLGPVAGVSDVSNRPLRRHEWWRQQYQTWRYARHLLKPELDARIHDIMLNLLLLTKDAKIGVLPVDDQSAVWMEKFTHMAEEMVLRYGPFPSGYSKEEVPSKVLPGFVSELGKRAAEAISARRLKHGDVLIKYGKLGHMKELYEAGNLRIQPASYFASGEHNGAVRDEELTVNISVAATRSEVASLVLNPAEVPSDLSDQRLDLRLVSNTDYWLYCLTESVEPRLFLDFEAEACVVIHNRQLFAERMRQVVHPALIETDMMEGRAMYVDPLLPNSSKLFVPLANISSTPISRSIALCGHPGSLVRA